MESKEEDEKQKGAWRDKNIYKKGRRKEYHIIYKLKEEGFDIAQRTAGSHSPIDIFAIDRKNKIIKLIQCKRTLNKTMAHIPEKLKQQLEEENKDLKGAFKVIFEAF